MKPLLASLADLKNALPPGGPALLLDVDGTISAIAPTPQEATVDPGCVQALGALAVEAQRAAPLRPGSGQAPSAGSGRRLVAAISGRPAAEVAAMVGVAGMVYVGNHGLERWDDGEVRLVGAQHPSTGLRTGAAPLRHAVDAALRQLKERLELAGIVYEHKGLTAAVHYRLSPDPVQARRAILKAARDVARPLPVQVHEGRMVVELRPAIKADKGTAVAALLEEYQPAAAFYLGDDLTDVDAFRALHGWAEQPVLSSVEGYARWGAAVAVLSQETPQEVWDDADYWLEGLDEVRQFLEWLAATYRTCPPAEVR